MLPFQIISTVFYSSFALLALATPLSSSHDQLTITSPQPVQFPLPVVEQWFRPIAWLKARISQALWRISPQDLPRTSAGGGLGSSIRSTQSIYGGDMVVRFNVSTSKEAEALAEASDTLFLDVWEFNEDWVDIHLAKDVVRPPCRAHSTFLCTFTYRVSLRFLLFWDYYRQAFNTHISLCCTTPH
jgi:hypothetical protein